MILRRDNIAWVQAGDGRASPLDVLRLSLSIMRAATQAGHRDWLLAESVGLALQEFVVRHCEQQTLTAAALADLVKGVLASLGYPDIAAAYSRGSQHAEVRLDQLSDTISELEFFQRLDSALQVTGENRLASVRLHGLRSCVMRLRGARYWSANCRRLAEEILAHIRARVARTRERHPVALQLTITE
ncbi:MAG: hypothetical protein FJ395_02945 [Verrucomicrobia bacterium]|nr:hypothetical protein [Verrucomicrobiota bacterium]